MDIFDSHVHLDENEDTAKMCFGCELGQSVKSDELNRSGVSGAVLLNMALQANPETTAIRNNQLATVCNRR